MGTILASSIIGKARVILQDATAVRWIDDEMLGWVNEGQREIVLLKPDASVTTSAVQLVAGTRQSIPATGIILLDVVRNMGSGSTPGRAIKQINRTILDEQIPTWHVDAPSNTALYFTYNDSSPKTFYIYPPQTSSPTSVEVVYSSAPTDCALVSSAIALDDIYAGSLIDYVLYRAYSKDAEYAGDTGLAAVAYKKFFETISGKEGAETKHEPPSTKRQGA